MIKKPKHKKTDKQKMVNRLDVLFSELIRKRSDGYCQRCGAYYGWERLQCCHFHGRKKYTVRWDERNAVALDAGCHRHIDSQFTVKEELARKILGDEEYERLYVLAEMTTKQSPVDYTLIGIYLKQKIQELKEV